MAEEMWAEWVAYAGREGVEEGGLQEPQPPLREPAPRPARGDPRAMCKGVEEFAFR